VWTTRNLINRTRLMAAKKGSASYHSHDLDADKIQFIQPIYLQAWSPRLSPLATLAEANAKEHGTMLSLQVSHHGVHRDEFRLHGNPCNITSEEQRGAPKPFLGHSYLIKPPAQPICRMLRYHRTIAEQFLRVSVAAGWSIYALTKHHEIIHCTARQQKN
jgi:hypothetical protein